MTTLKIGDKAPLFEALDNAGNTIKLTDYEGKKLVLFFYPKASTPGCTVEACNLKTCGLSSLVFALSTSSY